MIRNDYIMRMIEQLTIAMAKIAGLKVSKQYEESLQVAHQTIKDLLGLNKETFDSLDYKSLIYLTGFSDVQGRAKCIVLAELLKEEADIYAAQKKHDESYSSYLKSMNIFIEIILADKDLLSREQIEKIEEIYGNINKYEIPYHSNLLLFKYLELTGQYSKAEDLLFDLLDNYGSDMGIVNEGIAFYQRLMGRDESELSAGNLPVNEVIEGLSKLQLMLN